MWTAPCPAGGAARARRHQGRADGPLSSGLRSARERSSSSNLRDRIDAIDDAAPAAGERARAIWRASIGELKGDGPVYRPEREAQVLRRLRDGNPGPLPAEAVVHLFTEVISACRALEEAMSVAFLGPRGTFSEEAAVKHFGGQVRGVPCAFDRRGVPPGRSAARSASAWCRWKTPPTGRSGRTLDLLLATAAKICGEVLLPVHQCLMSKATDRPSQSQRVYAHAQSLAQCHEWLEPASAARRARAGGQQRGRRATGRAGASGRAAIGSQRSGSALRAQRAGRATSRTSPTTPRASS